MSLRDKNTRINNQINVTPIRLTHDNKNHGIMSLTAALVMARELELDLVEIAPHLKPPVCSLMDYTKFKFEQSKKKKEMRGKQSKEVKLRPVCSDHDLGIKGNLIKRFLTEKRNVVVSVEFRGRQASTSREHGEKLLQRLLTMVEEVGKLEQPMKMEGRRMICRLSPK